MDRDREADSKGILTHHPICYDVEVIAPPRGARASLKGELEGDGQLLRVIGGVLMLQLLLVLLLLNRRLTTPATVAAAAAHVNHRPALRQGRIIESAQNLRP